VIDIPFCVAGGIRAVADAERILHSGADKVSINSPALENPRLISDIADAFGTQCIVVGVDSKAEAGDWFVYQYTGDPDKTRPARRKTLDWIREAADRGAGEVVLNCMNQDGMRQGYDLPQLAAARQAVTIPIVASGGAGAPEHFRDVFRKARVDAALAASVFHKGVIAIADLKAYLSGQQIPVRQ
ncbi:MAG TPA: HisA/HisF-related TIM barrel protein, partial [Dongiaceae bacterium]